MAMRAKIKFNQSTKEQAVALLAKISQSFDPQLLSVEIEEIDYVPIPLRTMDLVLQDINSSSSSYPLEVILLNWTPYRKENSNLKVKNGKLLCNLSLQFPSSPSIKRLFEEFIKLAIGYRAREFAKNPVFTPIAMEEQIRFYMATQNAISKPEAVENTQNNFTKSITVDKDYKVWVRISEQEKINIPVGKGWESALFLFLLRNEKGFSFADFQMNRDSETLAHLYTCTKPTTEYSDVLKEIKYRIQNDQFSQFFSPHFSRIRFKISQSLGKYPELLQLFRIPQRGATKNILWDRRAIHWPNY